MENVILLSDKTPRKIINNIKNVSDIEDNIDKIFALIVENRKLYIDTLVDNPLCVINNTEELYRSLSVIYQRNFMNAYVDDNGDLKLELKLSFDKLFKDFHLFVVLGDSTLTKLKKSDFLSDFNNKLDDLTVDVDKSLTFIFNNVLPDNYDNYDTFLKKAIDEDLAHQLSIIYGDRKKIKV